MGESGLDKKWNRWLQDGLIAGVTTAAATRTVRLCTIADAATKNHVHARSAPGSPDGRSRPGN